MLLPILLSALLGSALAIPGAPTHQAASPGAPPHHAAIPSASKGSGGSPGIIPPPENMTCVLWQDLELWIEWGIFVPLKDRGPDGRASINTATGECGLGVLDNMRGTCGAITNWQCDPIDATGRLLANFHDTAAVGAIMNFNSVEFCNMDNVAHALEKATHAGKPECSRSGQPSPFCPPNCAY